LKITVDKKEDINPELKGSMLVVPDDEYENLLDAGDMSSPEDGTNDHTPESNYKYLPAAQQDKLLPHGVETKNATIVGRKHDHNGWPAIGKLHANPIKPPNESHGRRKQTNKQASESEDDDNGQHGSDIESINKSLVE
jgi:hypothetical protein